MRSHRNIASVLYDVFSHVYPSDSYSSIYDEFNYEPWNQRIDKTKDIDSEIAIFNNNTKNYRRQYITMLTSLLGWPNFCDYGDTLTWTDIFRNFFGWQKNPSDTRYWLNFFKTPFSFIKNVIVSLIEIPRNLVKFFTEFIPLTIAMSIRFLMDRINKHAAHKKGLIKAAFVALYLSLGVFRLLALGIHFAGRAITSPIKGVLAAFTAGQNLNGKGKGLGGNFLGILFASASIAVTVSFYAFLLPVIGLTVSASISLDFTMKMLEAFSNLPALSTLGTVLLDMIGPGLFFALNALGLAMPATMALSAIGGLLGATITIIGTPFSRLLDILINAWNRSASDPAQQQTVATATTTTTPIDLSLSTSGSSTHKLNHSLRLSVSNSTISNVNLNSHHSSDDEEEISLDETVNDLENFNDGSEINVGLNTNNLETHVSLEEEVSAVSLSRS
jgi:hypothetical protein